jgi:hypothetical protein
MALRRTAYLQHIRRHYVQNWGLMPAEQRWLHGPVSELPDGFHVLVFAPTASRRLWTYATCGMSLEADDAPLEVHLFAIAEDEAHVELLTMVAHFHRTCATLGIGHRVKFGRPWTPGSGCNRGYLSLPYLDGPNLEWLRGPSVQTRNLWIIPITADESAYVDAHGTKALEDLFEESNFNYANPHRPSVVPTGSPN